MKKILFISNFTTRITNFVYPSYVAANKIGYEFHLASNLKHFFDDTSKLNIKLHHFDISRNPFSIKNLRVYFKLIKLCELEKFDAIHCNTPTGGLLGRLLGKKFPNIKVLYTVHGFHFYKNAPLINNIVFKSAEKYLIRYTDYIITINNDDYIEAEKFKAINPKLEVFKVPGVGVNVSHTSSNCSEPTSFIKKLKSSKDTTILVSVGELNRNKNNIVIIKAMKHIRKSNVHYILCGVGGLDKKLKSIVKKYSLQNNVHFLGYRNDITSILVKSDIFVLPSFREGLSRSLMEAMSCGLPCIVSNIRGNKDLIVSNKGGFLHNPNDVNEVSNYINILVKDKKIRKTMGLFNHQKIEEYSVEKIISRMEDIYFKCFIND